MKRIVLVFLLLWLCLIASAGVKFAITPSASWQAEGVTNHIIYGSTNGPVASTNLSSCPIKFSAGTNAVNGEIIAAISDIQPGHYFFTVVAQDGSGHSSPEFKPWLELTVPNTPANFKLIYVEYSDDVRFLVSTNLGFFKVRIE